MAHDDDAPLSITKDTKIAHILERYGDVADVMEVFGVKRVGSFALRKTLGRLLTVERAAKVHGVPVEQLLEALHVATGQRSEAPS